MRLIRFAPILTVLSVILFLFLFSFAKSAIAACDPPECGDRGAPFPGDCSDWGPEYICVAKCCVIPNDGGGSTPSPTPGGGGGSVCPTGYEPVAQYDCRNGCTSPWHGTDQKDCGGCPPAGEPNKVDCCAKITCQLACNTTSATNIVITRASATSASLTWTPGQNGVSQRIYIGANKAKVEANCPSGVGPGTGCVEKNTSLSPTRNSYTTGNVLSPGTIYYYKIVTYKDSTCSSNSVTKMSLSSCLVSPSNASLSLGDTVTINTNVSASSEIGSVVYTPDSNFINVNPTTDSVYPYSTQVTGVSVGTGSLRSTVKSTTGTTLCVANSYITVKPISPWWQVVDSDISSKGDLNSAVKSPNLFGLPGLGGYPGVPSFASTTNLTNSTVSSKGWLVNSQDLSKKVFDYKYFVNQIPKDTVITNIPTESVSGSFFQSGGTLSYGYYWYKYDGSKTGLDLTLTSPLNLGDRKVILLVDSANFYINAPINLNDGRGFFLVIVGKGAENNKGNIIVDPAVGGGAGPNLEGIYEADNQFNTSESALQLKVRGSVVAYNGVWLQRDMGNLNPTTPAEQFEFAPDQVMLFPTKLGYRKMKWKEVAP